MDREQFIGRTFGKWTVLEVLSTNKYNMKVEEHDER